MNVIKKLRHKHLFSISFISYVWVFLLEEELQYHIYRITSNDSFNNFFGGLVTFLSYILFAIAVLYQLVFIVKFRKKEHIGLGRSIFMFFVRFFQAFGILCVLYLMKIYLFGYDVYTIPLPQSAYVGTYYGVEAWQNNLFAIIIAPPLLIITAVLTVIWKATKPER